MGSSEKRRNHKERSCRVLGCKEDHIRHYCRLCDQNDSEHFSRNCPDGTVLYRITNFVVVNPKEEEHFDKNSAPSSLDIGLDLDISLDGVQEDVGNTVILL